MNIITISAQELIDIIVDYLFDDPYALRACSQVGRSWSDRARPYIFSSIELFSEDDARSFGNVLKQSPRLAIYVQEVKLSPRYDSPIAMHDALGVHLPNIRKIELHTNVTLTTIEGKTDIRFNHFASAIHLECLFANFANLKQLQDVVSQFPRLTSLRFSGRTDWHASPDNTLVQRPWSMRLKRLDLRGLTDMRPLMEFCTWVCAEQPSAPRDLEFLEMKADSLNWVDLRQCAPTLREMHIHEFGLMWPGMQEELPQLPLLTTITINAFDRHHMTSTLDNLFPLLRVAAPQLSTIRITASVLKILSAHTTTVHWDRFFRFILDSTKHPPSLETVLIRIPKSRRAEVPPEFALDVAEREAFTHKDFTGAISTGLGIYVQVHDAYGSETTRRLKHGSTERDLQRQTC